VGGDWLPDLPAALSDNYYILIDLTGDSDYRISAKFSVPDSTLIWVGARTTTRLSSPHDPTQRTPSQHRVQSDPSCLPSANEGRMWSRCQGMFIECIRMKMRSRSPRRHPAFPPSASKALCSAMQTVH
jgi:hypothetical protein